MGIFLVLSLKLVGLVMDGFFWFDICAFRWMHVFASGLRSPVLGANRITFFRYFESAVFTIIATRTPPHTNY